MMSRRKKHRKSVQFLILFITVLILLYEGTKTLSLSEADRGKIPEPYHSPTIAPTATINLNSLIELYSPNAVVINLSNGDMLLDKDSSERIYPASLTKIMTAIVATEKLPDYNQMIPLPDNMFGELYTADASLAGFQPGEEVSALDLLYGVMLPSGAECCLGLAEYIAGSEEAFVELMNQKAAELGMENTHFTNSTGLHDDDHYSTVAELAKLLEYSLQNDTFRRIFTTERYSTSATNKHPDGLTMYSTMFKKLADNSFPGGKLLGGKTGYTDEAGLCLASLAKVGDKEYIMVSAGAEGDHTTEQYNITDALTVYSSLDDSQALQVVSEE